MTVRPLIGESFADCRTYYFGMIHSSQEFIPVLQRVAKKGNADTKKLALECIASEREQIRKHYATLKQLQKWFNSQDLDEKEPFLIKKEGNNAKKQQLLEKTIST